VLLGGLAAGPFGADRQCRQSPFANLERVDEPVSLSGRRAVAERRSVICFAAVRGSGWADWPSAPRPGVSRRDPWIGWNEEARREHLQEVTANSRFLIRPSVRAPNLASHALGLALRQVGSDWCSRYGYEPLLVETFVHAERFAGTCYQAANWELVGVTQGRGRQDTEHQSAQPVKTVWVYPGISFARTGARAAAWRCGCVGHAFSSRLGRAGTRRGAIGR
jgi:Domain of unknown function (DUF4338)